MSNSILPRLSLVEHFDANKEFTFKYTYLGLEKVITNELRIENVNGRQVYQAESSKFDKNHILPAGTLKNGEEYSASIRVKLDDTKNIWSSWSRKMEFVTLATPKYRFMGLQDTKYVYNNNIVMRVLYMQQQGHRVKHYRFVLMDENKIPLVTYPQRQPSALNPNVMDETIINLKKGKTYYVGVYSESYSGIRYFEYHEMVPHFAAPSFQGPVEAVNKSDTGQILVQGYLRQLTGIQTYADSPDLAGLVPMDYNFVRDPRTKKVEWVVIPRGRALQFLRLGTAKASDFVLKVWCRNIPDGTFLRLDPEDRNGIGIRFVKENGRVIARKEYLNSDGYGLMAQYTSNRIPNLGNKEFYMYVRVIEFRIDVEIEVIN